MGRTRRLNSTSQVSYELGHAVIVYRTLELGHVEWLGRIHGLVIDVVVVRDRRPYFGRRAVEALGVRILRT